jgi:hypothetical protein
MLPELYDDDGVRGALQRQGALRGGDGFDFTPPHVPPRTRAGALYLADSRRAFHIAPNGLVTAGAVATSAYLCFGMERSGSPRRLNVLAISEMALEYYRLAGSAVLPRVPGGWQHRIVAVRFDSGDPRELGPGTNPRTPPQVRAPAASDDRWDHTWNAIGEPERDAYEFLVWLYALFGLSAKTNPYVEGNHLATTRLQNGFKAG